MKEPICWQKAQNSDSEEIQTFIHGIMKEFGFTMPDEFWTSMPTPDQFNATGFLGVLKYQGAIIGTYAFLPASMEVADIQKIYLASEWRGNRLGKEMMLQLERIIGQRGYKKITMLSSGRYQAALRLYDHLGYQRLQRPDDATAFCDWQLEKTLIDG